MPDQNVPAPAGGVSASSVNGFIVDCLRSGIGSRPVDPAAVHDTFDLLTDAGLDSLGFLELVTRLEDAYDLELDLSGTDVAQVTQVGYLSEQVARASRQVANG